MPITPNATPTDARLTVRLLAREPHYIDREGRSRVGRPLALLAYLLLGRAPPTRDELLELLWEPEPGRDLNHRLRTLIHQVRTDVGPDAMRSEGREVVIDRTRFECDALEFLAHLDAGRLDAAMELYEAPLLMRGGPTDAPAFEDWASGVRAKLSSAFVDALLREAETSGAADPGRYARIAETLMRIAPTSPAAGEHSLRAALARDDAHAIGEAARTLRAAIAAGGAPVPRKATELLALADARAQSVTVPAIGAFDPPFTGRVSELAAARSLLGRSQRGGRGGLVGVAGQSGVGKTRFLAEIERLARIEGLRILRGRAYEVDSRTPYAVIVDALRPLFDEIPMRMVPPGSLEVLASLIPDLLHDGRPQSSRPAAEPVQIHAAVASLLENVARERPVVVLIDDVHWADELSRACLHRVALRCATAPIILAMAFRDEHERLVAPLFAAAPMQMCRLQPLTPAEVQELLVGIAPFRDTAHRDRLVRTLLASSGGRPLQLIQHLSHLREVGLLAVRDGAWELQGPLRDTAPGAAAEPVVALIARRLEGFSEIEKQVLAACAVLERYAAPREIAETAGLQNARIADQLDVLLRQRLVQAEGSLVGVAHAEIGNAALRMINGHRRHEMFEVAMLHAEADGRFSRPGISSLARLRLACGAGDRQRARLALLEVFAAALRSRGEALTVVAESVLHSAREWCPSPELYAQLHKESQRAAAEPHRIDDQLRDVRRRLYARGTIRRASRLIPTTAFAIAATVLIFLALPDSPANRNDIRFGGGGVLLLRDFAGQIRAVRFVGPGPDDTVPAKLAAARAYAPGPRFVSADGHNRIWQCAGENPDDREICLETVDGKGRRVVAPWPGEDAPAGWSPDGRFVLIGSDRSGSGEYNTDIFIAGIDDASVVNLSRDANQDNDANWSPDGTRIAFVVAAAAADTVVIVTTHGERLATFSFDGEVKSSEWSRDGKRLAVAAATASGNSSEIWVIETATGSRRRVAGSEGLVGPIWSPDGRLVAAFRPDFRQAYWLQPFLAAADSSIAPATAYEGVAVAAWLADGGPGFLERLVVPGSLVAMEGETFRVPIEGRGIDGSRMDIQSLTLSVAEPAVARAIGADSVQALAPGRSDILVSAGGWRSARVPLEVVPAAAPVLLMEEDWSAGIDTLRWKYFGFPHSSVVERAGRRAMRNNGDSLFPSGLVTRQRFPLDNGLALEWTQSTPLTGEFWQEIWIKGTTDGLDGFIDGHGDSWPNSDDPFSVQTPVLFHQPPVPFANLGCGGRQRPDNWFRPFDPFFSRNGFDRVLLQTYPTGGCDLFVNGRLVARLRAGATDEWPDSIRLAVGGRSYRTDILVGDVRIWRGIVARSTIR